MVIDIYGNAEIEDDVIKGNLQFSESYNLKKDLYVEGEVYLYGLSLNGYHLTVDGDCTLNNTYNYVHAYQKDGVLEVKGDLLYNGYRCFYDGSGTNQVILSGDKKQTIQANDIHWKFQELIIENTSKDGVYAAGLFDAEKIVDLNHKLSFYTEGNAGYTLTQDTVIQGDFNLMAGNMDLNGHKLTVTGNLMHRGGTLDINQGRLEVYGNYTLGNPNEWGSYGESNAKLYMDKKDSYIFFGGDVILAPRVYFHEHLTQGTIEIQGNWNYQFIGYPISIGEELLVRFTGNEKQDIIKTGHTGSFHFGTISLENTSAEGVIVQNDLEFLCPIKGNQKLSCTEGGGYTGTVKSHSHLHNGKVICIYRPVWS